MRIGQLARKHDIPVQEIIDYLQDDLALGDDLHPNTKLEESTEEKIFDYFNIELPEPEVEEATEESESEEEQEVTEESVQEQSAISSKELHQEEIDSIQELEQPATDNQQPVSSNQQPSPPLTPEEEIAALDGDLATEEERAQVESEIEEKAKEEITVSPEEHAAPNEDEIIQTDKLLEILESEDVSEEELEKIKLIKAPKKELAGLKVVGKVDLPEPKKKEEKEEDKEEEKTVEKEFLNERDLREYRNPRRKRQKRAPLTEEEKEARRLKAKAKKEAYEAREEKRRKQREAEELKARKAAHYKDKLSKTQTTTQKKKGTKNTAEPTAKKKEQPVPQKPKSVFGKIWKWLNASPYE